MEKKESTVDVKKTQCYIEAVHGVMDPVVNGLHNTLKIKLWDAIRYKNMM